MVIRSRKSYRNGFRLLGVTLLGCGLMAMGCAHVQPFEPPRVGEIPDGRGLFTGDKGALVLSRDIGANAVKTVPDDAQEVEPSAPHTTPFVPRAAPEEPGKPGRNTPPL